MTLAMNLPRCGSSLRIYRYDGDGVLFPTIACLKDEDSQYWKFGFNCPAELSDISPDDFKEQKETIIARNERQRRLSLPLRVTPSSMIDWDRMSHAH